MRSVSSSERIAKNTLALYARMLVNLVVSLYTSRVVLATLGTEDYGIYGVVGGVVGLFAFLNASQSGATSRFLTFEIGRGEKGRLPETFVSARIVHIAIALAVVILTETIGVWFLNHKLVIPEGRMEAARWVLQFSVAIAFLNVIQTPYTSAIIAHEKMGIYAYVEMLGVFLKLVIVYLLMVCRFDKLILYAALLLAVSLIIFLVYRIYCRRCFSETRASFVWRKDILRPLLSFSGFNLFGNMGSFANLQGTNFVVNMFFGVVYNAAAGVASTVSGAVEAFASNVLTAFRPQITKEYAREDYRSFESYIDFAIKAVLAVYCIAAVPAFIEMDKVMEIWLVEVPPCSVAFCRLLLINIFFTTVRYIITVGIHATAKVKAISLVSGLLLMANPFIIWMMFAKGLRVEYAYSSIIAINIILCCVDALLLKRYVPQIRIRRLSVSVALVTLVGSAAMLAGWLVASRFDPGIWRILLTVCVVALCIIAGVWALCLNGTQRQLAAGFLTRFFRKNER